MRGIKSPCHSCSLRVYTRSYLPPDCERWAIEACDGQSRCREFLVFVLAWYSLALSAWRLRERAAPRGASVPTLDSVVRLST